MFRVRTVLVIALAAGLLLPAAVSTAAVPRSLTCSSLGWMGGNPKSLQVANKANGGMARAGTTFRWTMSPSGQTGVITLDSDMKPGATRVFDGLLKGSLEQNADCKISAA